MNPPGATAESAAESAAAADSSLHLWDLIVQGGWGMVPLMACLTAALLLIGLGWLATRVRRFLPAQTSPWKTALQAGRTAEVRQDLAASDTALGEALAAALARLDVPGEPPARPLLEEVFMERLDAIEARFARLILYLNVIASVAPMIGLLGTVSGMIGAFQTIGRGGMGRPEQLAGDIGMALITTAAGLIVGIPAMLAYFGLRHRLAVRITETASAGESLLDAWAAGAARPLPPLRPPPEPSGNGNSATNPCPSPLATAPTTQRIDAAPASPHAE